MIPLVGFLPADDERVTNTIAAIERELLHDGFVMRYRPNECEIDGLPGGEGVFLPCSFWLADCLHLTGREKDARRLFERLGVGSRTELATRALREGWLELPFETAPANLA